MSWVNNAGTVDVSSEALPFAVRAMIPRFYSHCKDNGQGWAFRSFIRQTKTYELSVWQFEPVGYHLHKSAAVIRLSPV